MESRIALQQQPSSATLPSTGPRTMLAALLLVLLSGLPQLGVGLSGIDLGGERMTGVLPVTRSVLIDKIVPEAASLVPPHVSGFPPVLTATPPLPFQLIDDFDRAADEPKVSIWMLDLTLWLYRHHSSYV